MTSRNKHSNLWLVLGIGLLAAAHLRFGVGVLAWLAPAPLLHFLRLRSGLGARTLFVAASMLGWTLATSKIVTAPLPWVAALGFGVPWGLILTLPYLGSDLLRRRLGEGAGTLGFATLTVVTEWSMHALLPFGTWGSLVNTQLDQLALLQMSSVTGTHGVSAVMAVSASLLARLLGGERLTLRRPAMATALTVVGFLVFGQLRLNLASSVGREQRRVAAVGTDSMVGATAHLPDRARLAQDEAGLVHRTEQAARAGATIVVWTEAATMVWPDDEQAFISRLQHLAARLDVELVAAYVVPTNLEPLKYENKYVYLLADGKLDHSYFKHEPVPGEPAVRGTGPMPLVEDSGSGSVSGAICYDYDFPRIGLQHARLGADLVVVPSSDWRGIDPIHTQMASLRAIEGGHSLLRSTRFGTSAGYDAWGRERGSLSHFDGHERILIVDLPARGITTIYGRLGDWFPLTCALTLLGLAIRAVVRWRDGLVRSTGDGTSAVGGHASGDRGV